MLYFTYLQSVENNKGYCQETEGALIQQIKEIENYDMFNIPINANKEFPCKINLSFNKSLTTEEISYIFLYLQETIKTIQSTIKQIFLTKTEKKTITEENKQEFENQYHKAVFLRLPSQERPALLTCMQMQPTTLIIKDTIFNVTLYKAEITHQNKTLK